MGFTDCKCTNEHIVRRVELLSLELTHKLAKTLKEATELIEDGFEYMTYMGNYKLSSKWKTILARWVTVQMGSSASLV